MKHTKEDIVNALKVIKEECEAQSVTCINCPFFVSGCKINNINPANWELNSPRPELWRAFKTTQ